MKRILVLIAFQYAQNLSAQNISILLDIGSGNNSGLNFSVRPATAEDKVFFVGVKSFFNQRIYETDGTTEGTNTLMSDEFGAPENVAAFGKNALFTRFNNSAHRLYVSNGMVDEQAQLKVFPAGIIQQINEIADSKAIFLHTNGDDVSVWVTDGTANETNFLKSFELDFDQDQKSFFNEYIVFSERSSGFNKFEPFMTDGTEEGTQSVTDFIASFGATETAKTAYGTDGVLFITTTGSADYVFNDSILYSSNISGDLKNAVSVGNKHYNHSTFGASVFDAETKVTSSINVDVDFFGNLVADSTRMYYTHDNGFIYYYDSNSENSVQLSENTIGSNNFDPIIFLAENSLFYYEKRSDGNLLRKIDLDTEVETLIDTLSLPSGLVIVPKFAYVNEKLLYTKLTSDEGFEWWVYNSELNTKTQFESNYAIDLKVYPNPTSQEIQIDFPDSYLNGIISIYDISGKLIHQELNKNQSIMDIDISKLTSGQYLVGYKKDGKRSQLKSIFITR